MTRGSISHKLLSTPILKHFLFCKIAVNTDSLIFWYTIGMKFEYDSNKSEANKEKHGIDFNEAQSLWNDENLLEAPLNFPDEDRFLCIGKIGEKYWSAIITYRLDIIRIISVRRSRYVEVKYYENS